MRKDEVVPEGNQGNDGVRNNAEDSEVIPDTTHLSIFADPQPPTPPTPPAPQPPAPDPAPEDPNARHDWKKRMEDAQAAQRELERTRQEIRHESENLARLKAENEALLTQLRTAQAPPTAPAQPAAPASPAGEKIAALKAAYPELAEGLEELTRSLITNEVDPHLKTIEELRTKQNEAVRLAEEQAATARVHAIGNAVLEVHKDAGQLYNAPEFRTYIEALPPAFRRVAHDAIYENTAAYQPEDIIRILDGYKASRNTPRPAPSVAPNLSPANAGNPGAGPSGQSNVVLPLTEAERASFGHLMAQAPSSEARAHLMARLRLTLNPAN